MKILAYPKDSNPYQHLLYSHFSDEIKVTYLSNPTNSHILGLLLLPFQLIKFKWQDYKVVHLHWLYPFQFTQKNPFFRNPFFKIIFSVYVLFFVLFVKLLGFKLVWTAHNLTPHERQFINDQLVVKLLSSQCEGIITHANSTANTLVEMGVDRSKIEVIPIGNYRDQYLNDIDQHQAKYSLNLPTNVFTFGFFGRIEEYKGLLDLVTAFKQIDEPECRLLIAGPCSDLELNRQLVYLSQSDPRITLMMQFIPDEKVKIFMNAVDVFVFPFKKITTSSSVVLAMSFKRTVIAPTIGELVDFPEETGFFFNKSQPLVEMMKSVLTNKKQVKQKAESAFKFISQFTWLKSAQQTEEFFRKTLVSGR